MGRRAERPRVAPAALGVALAFAPALPGAWAQVQAQAQAPTPTPAPAATVASLDLAALMALLAQRKSGEARFTEERFVTGFDGPLRSAGTLSFVAPDRFARHTLEPRAESLEVAGQQLTLRRGGRTQRTTVDALPELGALLEAMRATLAGDAAALQRHFRARVTGDAALWTLALEPLDRQLAGQVRSVRIAGQRADLRSVELSLAGGDRSLMQIEPLPAAVSGAAAAAPAAPAAASVPR